MSSRPHGAGRWQLGRRWSAQRRNSAGCAPPCGSRRSLPRCCSGRGACGAAAATSESLSDSRGRESSQHWEPGDLARNSGAAVRAFVRGRTFVASASHDASQSQRSHAHRRLRQIKGAPADRRKQTRQFLLLALIRPSSQTGEATWQRSDAPPATSDPGRKSRTIASSSKSAAGTLRQTKGCDVSPPPKPRDSSSGSSNEGVRNKRGSRARACGGQERARARERVVRLGARAAREAQPEGQARSTEDVDAGLHARLPPHLRRRPRARRRRLRARPEDFRKLRLDPGPETRKPGNPAAK